MYLAFALTLSPSRVQETEDENSGADQCGDAERVRNEGGYYYEVMTVLHVVT